MLMAIRCVRYENSIETKIIHMCVRDLWLNEKRFGNLNNIIMIIAVSYRLQSPENR